MPRKYVIIGSAMFVMLSHVAVLPLIYFVLVAPTDAQRHDLAMLVAPLTAAYFVTITKFAIDHAGDLNLGADKVNLLYVFTAIVVIVPFIAAIFYLLSSLDANTGIDFNNAKLGVGLIEVFFGAAFALFIDSLFGKGAPG